MLPALGQTNRTINAVNQEGDLVDDDGMITTRIGENIFDPYVPVTNQSNQPLLSQADSQLGVIEEISREKEVRNSIDNN